MTLAVASAQSQQVRTGRIRLSTSVVPEQELEFARAVEDYMVGQPRAKRALRRAYRRYLDPLRDTRKPIYSIINVGPSRTGKTLSAEALAWFFHKNPECLLRINGGDYMEKEFLAQLTGARSTLVGYTKPDEMGAKDEWTKDPYAEFSPHNLFKYARRGSTERITIVLVDEWEKACIEFNNVLLAILDSGKLTLGNGVVVDFRNVIFVFTSNLGMHELERRGIGFVADRQKTRQDIESIVGRHMKERTAPEFRNRIKENGEVVVFDFLTRDEMFEVVERELNKVRERMRSNPETMLRLEVDEESKWFMLDRALAGEDGNISKLKDVIQAELLDKLGGELIKGTLQSGDVVEVVYEGEDELAIYRVPNGMLIGGAEAEALAQTAAKHGLGTADGAALFMQTSQSGQIFLPGRIGVSLDGMMMSELMFLQRAHQLKLAARLFPQMMARYNVKLTHAQNLAELTMYGTQLAQELTETLGAEIVKTETTYKPVCSVSLQVVALPGQVDIIRLRFPGVVVELDPSEVKQQ